MFEELFSTTAMDTQHFPVSARTMEDAAQYILQQLRIHHEGVSSRLLRTEETRKEVRFSAQFLL